jgi:hypothetical protein
MIASIDSLSDGNAEDLHFISGAIDETELEILESFALFRAVLPSPVGGTVVSAVRPGQAIHRYGQIIFNTPRALFGQSYYLVLNITAKSFSRTFLVLTS